MTFCPPTSAPSPSGCSISPPLAGSSRALLGGAHLVVLHIFQFPLTADELFQLSDYRWSDRAELERAIEAAVDQGVVVRAAGFHTLGEVGWGERASAPRTGGRDPTRGAAACAADRAVSVGALVSISGTLSKGSSNAMTTSTTSCDRTWAFVAVSPRLMVFKKCSSSTQKALLYQLLHGR